MSAIARVMLEMGYRVSGSDVARQELTEKLAAKGAKVFIGHDEKNVEGADLVVYSTALPQDNVEIQAAKRLNIPLIHRSQMLARLLETRKGIAVAGAHGKTTTSSMIALIMERCELDPTYIIGGEIVNLGSNAKAGSGEYVVFEADESDGSFLHYSPTIALVTNIEADHLENYDGDFGKLKNAYVRFLNQVKSGGKAVLCRDDPHLNELAGKLRQETITYGVTSRAEVTAQDIRLGDRKSSFQLVDRGKRMGRVELSVPGQHNVVNALAAYVVCREAGLTFAQFRDAVRHFQGAKRRFQVLGEFHDMMIVDDYAHHPTEIQATLQAAKATGKRIVAVFQPQRYTRTYFLLDQFSRAFDDADQVIVTDIYSPAGEKQIEGVSSRKLADLIAENSNPNVLYIPAKEDVEEYLAEHIRPGDLVLTMGAGDIWKTAKGLAEKLKARMEVK
jgi:UDP-N-acetylmuramate--alanine ligase